MFKRKGELNFVLIGAKATGKTVYLYNLNDRTEVTTSDAGSISYIASLKNSDDKDAKINATSISYTELYFNYKTEKYNIDFQIDDYDGNFVETWHSDENSDYKEKLTEYIKESEGIFVFLPYEEKDTEIRFASMKKETDTFIEKIKEEYGEEHAELPIPIVIAVTKWDNSPFFKAENEIDEAKKYIEESSILKDIKDKLSNYFKTVDIIPLSSEKNHNVTLPINMALDYTFNEWEKRIQLLQEKEDKTDLVIFLEPLIYDLRFYKDGMYNDIYKDAETEISMPLLKDIENINTLKEFQNYYEMNSDVLDSLSDEHKEIITKKELELSNKKKIKLATSTLIGISIFGLGIFGYNYYIKKEAENLLYKNIKIEYSSQNYSDALDNIKQYYLSYSGSNKEHYDEMKLLEENAKEKYRQVIDKKIIELKSLTSLNKKFKILTDINLQSKKYKVASVKQQMISKNFSIISKDKVAYDKALNIVSKMSLDTIKKEEIDKVLITINQLNGYDEAVYLKQELDQKLSLIINSSQECDVDTSIETLINLSSTVGITQEQLNQLNHRLAELKLKDKIELFVGELKSKDEIEEGIEHIAINWREEFGESTKIEVQKIMSNNFSKYSEEKLKNTPNKIEKIDNLDRLMVLRKNLISIFNTIEQLSIKIKVELDDNQKTLYDVKNKLIEKYSNILKNGVKTSSMTFYAPKSNSLGLSASEDRLSIRINGSLLYNQKNSNGAQADGNGYSMQFLRPITYYVNNYSIEVREKNIIDSDGIMSGSFNITENDLIKLYNQGSIQIEVVDTQYLLILTK